MRGWVDFDSPMPILERRYLTTLRAQDEQARYDNWIHMTERYTVSALHELCDKYV
jgi:hypothetical protein